MPATISVGKALGLTPTAILLPLRTSRAPDLLRNTALAIELRAEVASFTVSVKSALGLARAVSIAITAAFTFAIAASLLGKPTAFAKYSPISAESLVNFFRFSSCCLAETSDVTMAPAVTPAKLLISAFVSSKPFSNLADSNTGAPSLEVGNPSLAD